MAVYDPFQTVWDLKKRRDEITKELEDIDTEILYNLKKIESAKLTSPKFEIGIKTTPRKRATNAKWFAENRPDVYARFAHVQPAKVVDMLGKIYGGRDAVQIHLRQRLPDEFAKSAVINVVELEAVLGKPLVEEFQHTGGIYWKDGNPTGEFEISIKPSYLVNPGELGVTSDE